MNDISWRDVCYSQKIAKTAAFFKVGFLGSLNFIALQKDFYYRTPHSSFFFYFEIFEQLTEVSVEQ